MKNALLHLSFVLISIFAFGQSPEGINYQTVIRDGNGQPIVNSAITLKMSIRAEAANGIIVYSETHAKISNSFGLVNLVIGLGTPVEGEFSEISWGAASHFLETAIDFTGGGNFQVLGVTQFLSVPYSKYADNSGIAYYSTIANGIQTMSEQERDALENPSVGMQIYNSTSKCLNYFNGTAWFETCGQCTPLPTQANAGQDQAFDDATFSTVLQGNNPVHGIGTWTIESGSGGSFSNVNDPQTLFTGQLCESYSLKWSISTVCASISDVVNISFDATPDANAGPDASICQTGTAQLAGTAQNHSSVLWTTSGNGTFSNTTILNPVYTPGTTDISAGTVTLTLTVFAISPCTVVATDTKTIVIQKSPSASAGTDATICETATSQLTGTAQNQSGVLWTTSGTGTFSNANALITVYTPSSADKTAGTVMLTFTASAISPCTASVSDSKILTIQKTPTANAGSDGSVCQGSTHTLAGSATNQASVLWTTSGNGTFSSTSSLSSVYTPGTTDIANGTVTLTLTTLAKSPCTTSVSDSKILAIQKTPSANAGNDATICQGNTHTLAGSATNHANVLWTTSGNGTFSSANSLTPVYTPGTSDISLGEVTLAFSASAISPCVVSANDTKILTIQKSPTANAGTDATICQTETAQLTGIAQNQNSVLWSSSGNGTFSSTTTLTPVYTPGTNDILAGTATLTFTASAISPCTVSFSDNKILFIQKTPNANAGADATICQTATHQLSGTAQNQSSVLWTSSGNGTFSNSVILNPVYTPGATDISAGSVTLNLIAAAISPCSISASDTKILTIRKTPVVNAGIDATICQGNTHQLSGSVQNQNSVLWTTSGNGTFSSTSALTPVYTPGATDISNGTVTLTLTASAISPCTVSATDSKTLIIQKTPLANAGVDATICQGNTHQLSGIAQNQSSVLWATSGNGTFSSTNSLTPIYSPSVNDISLGTVTLTMTASAISPCTVSVSDNKILVIQKTPTANAGIDATRCQGSTHQLAGSASNQSSILWTTSGNGTFSSATILNPVYTPGANDISLGTVTLTLTSSAVTPCTVSASDNKILIIQKSPTADAGLDATVSQGNTHQLTASAQNYSAVSWTTSGNGSFSNANILNPVYTPGAADINAGNVTLTLTASAISPCTISVSDSKILTIQNFQVDAVVSPNPICIGSNAQLSAIVVVGSGGPYTYSWTSVPAGFTSPLQTINVSPAQTTKYYLTAFDGLLTSVDSVTLEVKIQATANAGTDATICQTSTHQLSGTAQNNGAVTWTTSGNGTFSSTTVLNPIYTPGTSDIIAGNVILTLTASAVLPCTQPASDNKTLIIRKTPVANAGNDATICQTATHQLSGSAQNLGGILWTTSGNGTFSSTSVLSPVYTPGATDISNGTVTLTLTASAISPCTVSAFDTKVLVIRKTPTANAGIDATICQTETHQLSGTAQNQNSVLWSTSGNGTFSSTSSLTPVYTPGANDISLGTVTLTMTASAVSPCTVSVSDNKILIIQKSPTANAGIDATICQGSTHTLAGSASNQSSVLWTTSGTGTFSSTSILNPVYTPGISDITAGTVTLTMTSLAVSPCTVSVSDNKILVIQKTPTANAGIDATICQGSTHTLAGSASNQSSVLWTTSGNGTFSSTTSLSPVYTPGTSDITAGNVNLTLTAEAVSPCSVTASDTKILFFLIPSNAVAGQDMTIVTEELSINLSANTPQLGSGLWTIVSGEGGVLENPASPTTLFTGQPCTNYLLVWSISTSCDTSSDTVSVTFFTTPTPANAGDDQTITQATWTTLAANTPLVGQGQWTIIQGTGGQLVTPNSPNSLFLGQTNSTYIIEWKITTDCIFSSDNVTIGFNSD